MKPKNKLQILVLLALLLSSLNPGLNVKALPRTQIIIVNRTLTYWDATYTGYVDATQFEKWQFSLDQTYTFTITAIQSSGNLIPRVRLLNASSIEVASQTGALTTTQPAGNYFIQIEPVSGSGTYSLTIRQISSSTSTPTPTRTSTFTPIPPTSTSTRTSTPIPSTATPTRTSSPTVTSTVNPSTATPTRTATHTATSQVTSTSSGTPNASIQLSPANVNVNGTSTATVSLNNPAAGGYTGAEFTCTYNPAQIQLSNFTAGNIFGPNPVMVVNGPANGTFILAIAGSNGNKATASGPAFTFSVLALQAGQASIQCAVKVSSGSGPLTTISSTPASLTITVPQGNLAGQVISRKPVTISLYYPNTTLATSVVANANGTFNLTAVAGSYTVIASSEGYLEAQGAPSIVGGATTTMQTVTLRAGDIDNNNVINQLDALTIGMNYNLASPTAADLNNDGTINVLDLELLAGNYGQSGSLNWLTQ